MKVPQVGWHGRFVGITVEPTKRRKSSNATTRFLHIHTLLVIGKVHSATKLLLKVGLTGSCKLGPRRTIDIIQCITESRRLVQDGVEARKHATARTLPAGNRSTGTIVGSAVKDLLGHITHNLVDYHITAVGI